MPAHGELSPYSAYGEVSLGRWFSDGRLQPVRLSPGSYATSPTSVEVAISQFAVLHDTRMSPW